MLLQSSASRVRRTDDRNREAVLCGTCDEIGGKITTCNNWKPKTADPSQAAQHAAIAKHSPRPLVERPHRNWIFKQPHHVVYVWRHNISKTSIRLRKNIASRFFDRSSIETKAEEANRFLPSCRSAIEMSCIFRLLGREEFPFLSRTLN